MNLRGKFMTDAQGHFGFRSVKPAGYPIPIDGPVGDLVRATGRHHYRPAHLHFLIFKPGFKTLISQIYVNDDERLETDVQFGVTRALIGNFVRHDGAAPAAGRDRRMVFARSDFRDGARQKPAAQAADPVIRGKRRPPAVDLAAAPGVPCGPMNALSSRPLPAHPLALPNLLTYGRIAAVPVVVGLMYWQSILGGGLWLRWLALAIFIAAGLSDILDGYFARMWGQQSSLGRMLDPIADKLLVASCLLMLAAEDTIRGWTLFAAVIILCREILVSGLREYLAELRVGVPVTRLAKWKTIGQLVAIGFLIAGEAGDSVLPQTTEIGIALLWLSAMLTLYTGWDYMRAGLRYNDRTELSHQS